MFKIRLSTDATISRSLVALNNMVMYLGHDTTPTDNALEVVLSNLQSQIYHLYRTFDDSGLSEIIWKEASGFLQGFSYVNALQFRTKEMALIQDAVTMSRSWGKYYILYK